MIAIIVFEHIIEIYLCTLSFNRKRLALYKCCKKIAKNIQ